MSGLLRDLALTGTTINADFMPSSNLELIDLILSGKAEGPLADIVLNIYAKGYEDARIDESLSKEVRSILEDSLSKSDELLKRACNNIEENKGHCYIAKDSNEAKRIVGDIVGSGKIVIKSFSWVVEETGAAESLVDTNEVWDAALPPTSASLLKMGVPRSELLSTLNRMKIKVNGGISKSIESFYREKLYRADVGITGTTALAADPGALAFLSESGVDRLITMTPEVHIALVGIDQVVESYSDAFKVSEFLMKVNGDYSFFGIIGGPSKTGDIEKRVTYGAHGPRELHIILVDNGRSKAMVNDTLRRGILCLRPSKLPFKELWPLWRSIIGLGMKENLPSLERIACPLAV